MTDNAIITKDGATAGHVQESGATVSDSGTINIPTGATFNINGTAHTHTGLSTYDSDVIFQAITTGNADSDNHGFLPALSGDSDTYLDGKGTWGAPAGGSGLTSSVTTLTPTTGNDTATVTDDINYHFADVSGMTADRSFVVPAGTAKQEIILNITTGDDTYEYVIIGDTGISINGGSAATEWSRLFITGESIKLVATSTTNWQVVEDGRIGCVGKLGLSSDITTNTAGAVTQITWDLLPIDIGNLGDTTNYRFNIRRDGYYELNGIARPYTSLADQKYYGLYMYDGDSTGTQIAASFVYASGSGAPSSPIIVKRFFSAGDIATMYFRPQDANMGALGSNPSSYTLFEIKEI